MPLSEEEARLLAQLEQSLAAEDPEFASALRGSKLAARYRRIASLSGVGFVLGIVLLLAGAVNSWTWLGALGFLVMVAGAYGFIQSWRLGVLPGQEATVSQMPHSKQPGFVHRMEERWQRRQDEGPF